MSNWSAFINWMKREVDVQLEFDFRKYDKKNNKRAKSLQERTKPLGVKGSQSTKKE